MSQGNVSPAGAPPPALFLHIQKTAGTSLILAAADHYGWDAMLTHGGFVDKTPQAVAHLPFVSGHFGYRFARPLLASRYSFTFLRDPIERLLSLYYFCRTRDPDEYPIYRLARSASLDVFLRGVFDSSERSQIWNHQVWQLAMGDSGVAERDVTEYPASELLALAKTHLAEFSHVGFTETADADLRIVLAALGMGDVEAVPRANVSPGKPARPQLPRATMRLLHSYTELDRALYAWARRRYGAGDRRWRWWRR